MAARNQTLSQAIQETSKSFGPESNQALLRSKQQLQESKE